MLYKELYFDGMALVIYGRLQFQAIASLILLHIFQRLQPINSMPDKYL